MTRTLLPGGLAGLIAGLAVACRDLLIIITWAHLRDPAQLAREAGLMVAAYAAVGMLLGIGVSLLLPSLLRLVARVVGAGRAAPVTGASLVVLALAAVGVRTLVASEVAQAWLDIGMVMLTLLALAHAVERSAAATVAWLLSVGVGLVVADVVFFAGQALANDLAAPALRALAYLALAALAAAAGVGVWRLLSRPMGRVAGGIGPTRLTAVAVAVVMAPALALSGWHLWLERSKIDRKVAAMGEQRTGGAGAPNIILISVDTLRADAPGYAGGAARTPTIDALAAESFVFERAYSVAPWTRPSFASFFSGLYPSEMGVARIRGFDPPGSEAVPYRWREEPLTLTEVLRDAGYRTVAVVTNGQLTTEAAADQGFDFFHNCKLDVETTIPALAMSLILRPPRDRNDYERADYLSPTACSVIPRAAAEPALVWLHYMDPHFPYDAPGMPPAQRIDADKADVIARLEVRTGPTMQAYIDAYRAEVEFCDRWLDSVVRTLKSKGLWDSSIVVFWSDHGEEFWEHGSWEHGQSLFDELLHVPLLIHMPGQTTQHVVAEPVSLLDVMPTLLEVAGCEGPEMRGRSLAPVLSDDPGELAALHVFLESSIWGNIRKGLLTERYKLIYDVYHDRFSLYDLAEDPGELHDIWGTPLAPDTAQWERELMSWTEESLAAMAGHVQSGREHMSPEMRQHLKDMGYIQ